MRTKTYKACFFLLATTVLMIFMQKEILNDLWAKGMPRSTFKGVFKLITSKPVAATKAPGVSKPVTSKPVAINKAPEKPKPVTSKLVAATKAPGMSKPVTSKPVAATKALEKPKTVTSKPVAAAKASGVPKPVAIEPVAATKASEKPKPVTSKPVAVKKAPVRRKGIPRSAEEQQKEAIGILSAGLRGSANRLRRLLEIDRNCDWMSGRWVRDESIVYGKGILSGYLHCPVDSRQNCKRNYAKAPYLGYRWVLNDEKCEANRIRFTRERFLIQVQGKKIAFIGDSLTRNMFQSLACLLYVPKNKTEMVKEHLYRFRYPRFNVTIEFIKSNYLVKQTRSDCDSNATVKLAKVPCLDIKTVDPTWAARVHQFDIFMFATGGWWEHDIQMRHVQTSSTDADLYINSQKILYSALNTVMEHLKRAEFQGKELYWRCSEVSHFFGGEWNTGGQCQRLNPSNHSISNAVSLFIEQAVIESLTNAESNITLFDITEMSSYRQDAHPSSQAKIGGSTDCKHWCLPGVPDHWNEIWLNLLNVKSTLS